MVARAHFDGNTDSEKRPTPSSEGSGASKEVPDESAIKKPGRSCQVPAFMQWIPDAWTWSNIKVAIRCALAAWIVAVLFVIPSVETALGQASFLMLIASFLSPPNEPFMAVLERETAICLYVTIAWAWSCLGMRLADLARRNRNPAATFLEAVTGQYIEAGPSVILAVFLFFGSSSFLYIKARLGPGPYMFPCIFACICLNISLTTSALFPYPFYRIGKAIVLPLCLHSAVSLLTCIFIFPTSMSAQFTSRLQGVLGPLISSLEEQRKLLKSDVTNDQAAFKAALASITASVNKSEGALVPLAASARLLRSDLIYSRFAPTDFSTLRKLARRLAVRGTGMPVYFALIDPGQERFPITPAPSRPSTPGWMTPATPVTPVTSGPPSVHSDGEDEPSSKPMSFISRSKRRAGNTSAFPLHMTSIHQHPSPSPSRSHHSHSHPHPHTHSHSHSHHRHSNVHTLHHVLLHNSLIQLAMPKAEQAVGVFESQRYLNLDAKTHTRDPNAAEYTSICTGLLSESCDDLLGCCATALRESQDWLVHLREGRWSFWKNHKERNERWWKRQDAIQKARDELVKVLDLFRHETRHRVLEPYRPGLEAQLAEASSRADEYMPDHRHLFRCYVYQYHTLQFASLLVEMLDEILRLERERSRNRLWTPARNIFTWHIWEPSDQLMHGDEEDPDLIQGIEPNWMEGDLGMPRPRDPDALPPSNPFEWVMNFIYRAFTGIGGGNLIFALKAGLLTILMCLPSFLKSSASFAYLNRFVWAIIMAQLGLGRFRGDTTFGFVARIGSTFLGGVLGMVIWYISCGNGRGNAYGLAAVLGVCFPFFFYARLYWPGPPMSNTLFFVTSVLVVGYSYQDLHIQLPGSPGFGFTVFWKRVVTVAAGVTAAFIFSFFPPATTIRAYHRATLATTTSEIGAIYCSIISFANSRRERESSQEIVTSLIAIRSKLKRSLIIRANVVYEFSLRGKWPSERYHKLLTIQLEIAYSLSHLLSVVEHLEPVWARAFLRRCRFLDPDFQGDVLAVINMITTSLRSGNPLPQITPCPLLDRFMARQHGLVIHTESEEDYGLPRTLTLDTLQNEQYMMFCVGISTAFGIVTRLDRLMVAAKEVVGEQYHIHGVGLTRHGVELGMRQDSVPYRVPQDV